MAKLTNKQKQTLIPLPEQPGKSTRRFIQAEQLIHDSDSVFPEEPGRTDMSDEDYQELADLIRRSFGIELRESKRTLVLGRLYPLLEKYGFRTHTEGMRAVRQDTSGVLLSELANALSTNHTAFYRESQHFNLLSSTVLPALEEAKTAAGDKDLRIWCAACATGEEAYTILFTMLNYFSGRYAAWKAGLLATDISRQALDVARKATYTGQQVQEVPGPALVRWFDQIGDDTFVVKKEVRDEVTFRRFNLMTQTYPFRQPFDCIFCRNVMMYFPHDICMRLLRRLREWIVPGGFLFVGHSEAVVHGLDGWEYVAPSLYRRT